jgi:hypothetical protein
MLSHLGLGAEVVGVGRPRNQKSKPPGDCSVYVLAMASAR